MSFQAFLGNTRSIEDPGWALGSKAAGRFRLRGRRWTLCASSTLFYRPPRLRIKSDLNTNLCQADIKVDCSYARGRHSGASGTGLIRQRVKSTRIGPDVARTGCPARSSAGSNRERCAHASAVPPKPWPGSLTSFADSTLPSGRTATRSTTVCSSIPSASASAGQGQSHSLSGRRIGCDRSPSRADPVPSDTPAADTAPLTVLVLVPVLDVLPPA